MEVTWLIDTPQTAGVAARPTWLRLEETEPQQKTHQLLPLLRLEQAPEEMSDVDRVVGFVIYAPTGIIGMVEASIEGPMIFGTDLIARSIRDLPVSYFPIRDLPIRDLPVIHFPVSHLLVTLVDFDRFLGRRLVARPVTFVSTGPVCDPVAGNR